MGAAGGIDYTWTGPNGFSSDQQYPEIPDVTNANTGLYIVNVTDHNGCVSADSTTLTIYDAPIGTISLADTSICEGSSYNSNMQAADKTMNGPLQRAYQTIQFPIP